MKYILFIACITILLFPSCKHDPDGTYIIYETRSDGGITLNESNPDFDYYASEKLRQEYQGRKMKVEFDKDYIMLTNQNNRELILKKEIEYFDGGSSDTSYIYSQDIDGRVTEFVIKPNYFRGEHIINMWVKVQGKELDSVGNAVAGKFARIRSTLKKRNEN